MGNVLERWERRNNKPMSLAPLPSPSPSHLPKFHWFPSWSEQSFVYLNHLYFVLIFAKVKFNFSLFLNANYYLLCVFSDGQTQGSTDQLLSL